MASPLSSNSAALSALSSLFIPFSQTNQASTSDLSSLLGGQITTLALGEEGGLPATPVSSLNPVLSGADANRDNKVSKEELNSYAFQLNIVTVLLDVFLGFTNLPALGNFLAPLKEQLKGAMFLITNYDKLATAGADGDNTALSALDISTAAQRDGDASSISAADLVPPPPPAPTTVPTIDAIRALFMADNGDGLVTKDELSARRLKAQQELEALQSIVNIQFDPAREAQIQALQAEISAEDYLVANFTVLAGNTDANSLTLAELLEVAGHNGNIFDLAPQDLVTPVLAAATTDAASTAATSSTATTATTTDTTTTTASS